MSLIGFILAINGVAGIPCDDGSGNPTALGLIHTYEGNLTLTPTNLDTTKYCEFQVTEWNSAAPGTVKKYGDQCSSILTGGKYTFTEAWMNSGYFRYGERFTVTLTRRDSAVDPALCVTTASVQSVECRGVNLVKSTMRIWRTPAETIVAEILNRPSGVTCRYSNIDWGGAYMSDTRDFAVDAAGCASSTWAFNSGVSATGHYEFKAAAFNPGSVSGQPVCGVNSAELTLTKCGAGTLAITNTGIDEITATITGAAAGAKCQIYLTTWDGTTLTTPVVKISPDCTSVKFSSDDVGVAFAFGANNYKVGYAQFNGDVSDYIHTSPICWLPPKTQTFAAPVCTGAATATLIDASSVAVSLAAAIPLTYGVCRLKITQYGGAAITPIVRVSLCTQSIVLESDGATVLFGPTRIDYEYSFFANGDISGSSTCDSASMHITPASYSPTQTLVATPSSGTVIFSLAPPAPRVGTCHLLVKKINSVASSGTLTFDRCGIPLALTVATVDLVAVGAWKAGSLVEFNYDYDPGTGVVASPNANVQAIIHIPVTLSVDSTSTTSLVFTYGYSTAIVNKYKTDKSVSDVDCDLVLESCNAVSVPGVSVADASCSKANGSGAGAKLSITTGFTSGQNCIVRMYLRNRADNSNYIGISSPISVRAAGTPSWGATQEVKVAMKGSRCMSISWDPVANDGNSPITCYRVLRQDGSGSIYPIRDCDDGNPLDRSAVACDGFVDQTSYLFHVAAVNALGSSSLKVSGSIRPEFLRAAPDSQFIAPSTTALPLSTVGVGVFPAGGLPAIRLQEQHPLTPLAGVATDTTTRLFLAQLVSRCKLDSTGVVKLPITATADKGYTTANLPIPKNAPPAFTTVFTPVGGMIGRYDLPGPSFGGSGVFSLLVWSLEGGGLRGDYWTNPTYNGSPANTQKDAELKFSWGTEALLATANVRAYDLVSIRWTGFIEAPFSETFTFIAATNEDAVRVWIDDVLIINRWTVPCDVCSGRADLQQSSSGTRKFSSIRVEYMHSKGATQGKEAAFSLRWVSFSQPLEDLPFNRLFYGAVVGGAPRYITVSPGSAQSSKSTYVVEAGPYLAGTEYTITITALDAYGNEALDTTGAYTAEFPGGVKFLSVPENALISNGKYVIRFKLTTTGGPFAFTVKDPGNVALTGNIASINVVAGVPTQVTDLVVKTGNAQTVGSPLILEFKIKDTNGNVVENAAAGLLTFVSMVWESDASSQGILVVDDVEWRSQRFGVIFDVAFATPTYDSVTKLFSLSLLPPRAGDYSVAVGVRNGAAPDTLTLIMAASAVSAEINAVINMETFPPTNLVSGQTTAITVQLRDQYMNALVASPTSAPSVKAKLQGSADVTCNPVANTGRVVCNLSPSKAGTDLSLAITVNGVFASYLYHTENGVRSTRGPWLVSVSPGAVSAANCLVTGLRKSYVVGKTTDVTVWLRDAAGNPLTGISVAGNLAITAKLEKGAVIDTMNPNTFTYNTLLSTVTIPIVASTANTGYTLTISVGGNSLTLPHGLGTVDVEGGILSASNTVCGSYANGKAQISRSALCTTKDAGDVALQWDNAYLRTYFVHKTDASVAPIVLAGTQKVTPKTQYEFSTSALVKAGDYSYYSLIAQPGGLRAQYYAQTSFETLVADGNILQDLRGATEPPIFYSAIEPVLNLAFGGPMVVDEVTVRAIKWRGLLKGPDPAPGSAPAASASVNFKVIADGGMRIKVDATELDLLTASTVDTSIIVTLMQDAYYPIEVDYLPGSSASFQLLWKYGTVNPIQNYHVVPPSYMHAILLSSDSQRTVSVTPAAPSTMSVATFSEGIVSGAADMITIQVMDAYGNAYTSSPSDATTTYTFEATQAAASNDGTVFSASSDKLDGTFTISFNFVTDGVKQITIKINDGTTATELANSPFTIVVSPGV